MSALMRLLLLDARFSTYKKLTLKLENVYISLTLLRERNWQLKSVRDKYYTIHQFTTTVELGVLSTIIEL